MKKQQKTIKRRYILFISLITVFIIAILFTLQNSVNSQILNSKTINLVIKQSLTSQEINKQLIYASNRKEVDFNKTSLKELVKELDGLIKLQESNKLKQEDNTKLDSLLNINNAYLKRVLFSSNDIINNSNLELINKHVKFVANTELPYLNNIETLVKTSQDFESESFIRLKRMVVFLLLGIIVMLVSGFFFVLRPTFKAFLKKNLALKKSNEVLKLSEKQIKENLVELKKLKSDLELKEGYNKIFIEQAPTAMAMLDSNMCYMAVSEKWISDYKMEGKTIVGRSHYELFPNTDRTWKERYKNCLAGAVDSCSEAPFELTDGTIQWIFWDIKPWYISKGNIGGLIVYTGDITEVKKSQKEKILIEEILDKTNEIARIGTWELDLVKNKVYWSKVVCEIHEVPEGYQPDLETGINFYKEGASRNKIEKCLQEAIEQGKPYDVEVELVTSKGKVIWTRAIGQVEFINGKCARLFGVFQDISEVKFSQTALKKAHIELKAIFNSGPIAIITTDNDGVVNHFNYGAELMLGYSANEIVGFEKPEFYHLEDELLSVKNECGKANEKLKDFNVYEALTTGKSFDRREWTYRRKDGSILPVELTLTAIKDDNEVQMGYMAVATNISERKKSEYEILKKNQLLLYAEKITMMGNWQWDVVTNIVKWSPNLYNIFGIDEKEYPKIDYGSSFKFIHPDDLALVTSYVQKSIANKQFPDNFEYRIITKKGELKIVRLLGEVVVNKKGEVVELIGTCQDVTEQKMAEKKFKGLLESAPDAMVIVDEKRKIQLINKQAERLFGYSEEELLNKSVEILLPNRYHQEGYFSKLKTRAVGIQEELYGKNKDGKEIPVQMTLSPLKTEEGYLLSAAIRDITAQKEANLKIVKAKDDLELYAKRLTVQNTQLADFAQITSHNLRAPVSNLNSLLYLHRNAENEEDKALLFNKFEKTINSLTLTLNTLVEAVKTKNNESIITEDIDFKEVIFKTQEVLSGEIIKTNAVINTDFSSAPKINYNKEYLESIFLNLVGNAIKYKSKDKTPKINIETKEVNGEIQLVINDNGLGINMSRHGKKLFGLNKTFHRHPDAKGIGLYMTKVQIEAMGGTIKASSKVGEGTNFIINF